jgi:hypothetical protein
MFDSRIGRWLEEDPCSFAAGDANLYRYVGNDAPNAVDRTGLRLMGDEPSNLDIGSFPTGFELYLSSATVKSVQLTSLTTDSIIINALRGNAQVSDEIATSQLQNYIAKQLPLDFKAFSSPLQVDKSKKTDLSGKTWILTMNDQKIYVPANAPGNVSGLSFTITVTAAVTLDVQSGWIAPAVFAVKSPGGPIAPTTNGPPESFWRRWLQALGQMAGPT